MGGLPALLECCCGLDVHRDTIVACILRGSLDEEPKSEIRTFSTLPDGIYELRQWLELELCMFVAMESTGIYWQPVYDELETAFDGQMVLLVVNARHIKNVPGRKTDKKDSEWIATLLRAGLLRGSFIPTLEIRELRDLTRYRVSLAQELTAQKNRVEKLLQGAGIKLSSFVSDVFGVSGRNMLGYISLHGSLPFELMKDMLKGRLKSKEDEITRALQATLSPHQQEMLQMLLRHLDQLNLNIHEVETKVETRLKRFQEQVELLSSIPGIKFTGAAAIISEIGIDMSQFMDAGHIASWAGMSPGSNESAGKKKSARALKGNPRIKRILCEIAWVVTRMRNTYLSQWYWKVKARRGAKKAIVALGRRILTIIYAILKSGSPYAESKVTKRQTDQTDQTDRRKESLLRELKRLGVEVQVVEKDLSLQVSA